MREFCPVRFKIAPFKDTLFVQCKMTWGEGIRNLYPDYWGWTNEVQFMARKSVARPVVMGITGD